MGADQLVRLLPAYKEEDNSTVWKAVDSVLLGLDKVKCCCMYVTGVCCLLLLLWFSSYSIHLYPGPLLFPVLLLWLLVVVTVAVVVVPGPSVHEGLLFCNDRHVVLLAGDRPFARHTHKPQQAKKSPGASSRLHSPSLSLRLSFFPTAGCLFSPCFLSLLFQILKADEDMSKRFSKLAAGLLKPIAAKVGWEPKDTDGHSGKLLRATVIELLAT